MKNGGGHFAPELGAHFKLELGGQYHWNLHLHNLGITYPKLKRLILAESYGDTKMVFINVAGIQL